MQMPQAAALLVSRHSNEWQPRYLGNRNLAGIHILLNISRLSDRKNINPFMTSDILE